MCVFSFLFLTEDKDENKIATVRDRFQPTRAHDGRLPIVAQLGRLINSR